MVIVVTPRAAHGFLRNEFTRELLSVAYPNAPRTINVHGGNRHMYCGCSVDNYGLWQHL
jgi:hypothetical protein